MEGRRETLWQNWRQDSTVQDADVRVFKGQTGISGDLGEGHCQETSAVALEKGARNGVGDTSTHLQAAGSSPPSSLFARAPGNGHAWVKV